MWSNVVVLFVIYSGCLCESDLGEDYVTTVDLDTTTPRVGSRIVGGVATSIQNYPYVVQVLNNNQLSCGGALLTQRHVLSAAHCFVESNGALLSARSFSVRAGATNVNTGGTRQTVSRIIIHERYNVPLRDNDIAVLLLSRRLSLGASVALASIPQQGGVVPDNATVFYVGWGTTIANVPSSMSATLREAAVRKVSRAECAARYGYLQAQTGQPFPVTNSMICAGLLDIGGRDACQGDSGGPVVYNGVVVGAVSWGWGCGNASYPGVSARVASYSLWITDTVNRSGAAWSGANAVSVLAALMVSAYTLQSAGWPAQTK